MNRSAGTPASKFPYRDPAGLQTPVGCVAVGSMYVNRDIIGAIVETLPFGGCSLSGTGPKAGGPRHLHRFAHQRTLTINTSAVGGNASLLAME